MGRAAFYPLYTYMYLCNAQGEVLVRLESISKLIVIRIYGLDMGQWRGWRGEGSQEEAAKKSKGQVTSHWLLAVRGRVWVSY